jgi:hypothetical protein
MNNLYDDDEIDTILANAFASQPKADFEEWRRQHPESLACLDPQRIQAVKGRRRLVRRTIIFALSAAVLACVWLNISNFGNHRQGSAAFAAALEQIQKAKTITWKLTFYEHHTSKDGKKTWLKTDTRQCAYKTPGLYRETSFDQKGQIWSIEIRDAVHRKIITLLPQEKKAIISEPTSKLPNPSGPFDWVMKELEDPQLQWVERRKTAGGEINIFRHAFRDIPNGRDWSYDFWIDQKTKQLVELHVPGADIYDPDKDPARNTPPGKKWSGTVPSHSQHDIVWDADLDESLFRLDPPEEYTVDVQVRGQVTEKEMIDYLGIVADFNDKMFPDQVFPFEISNARVNINKAWDKPKKVRTAAEQKAVETIDHYIRNFQSMPTWVFVEQHTMEKSFRYLGKGVKLGDKDRIVCWYKLKDAKDPTTYRVVYGDLSVKDVASEDLPLPVDSREEGDR